MTGNDVGSADPVATHHWFDLLAAHNMSSERFSGAATLETVGVTQPIFKGEAQHLHMAAPVCILMYWHT